MSKHENIALHLAERLEAVPETGADPDLIEQAAAEPRRMHAANLDCMAWYESIKADYEAMRKAVVKLHAAKGRYHTQIAACDLYDLLGLKNERPTK